MRETKFRGMDVNGKWYYGNITILKQNIDSSRRAGCYISNSAGMPFAYNVRPGSVGQFTGLHDKNGREIYEGDVVRQSVLLSVDMADNPVKWIDCGFVANGLLGKREAENCEVIGNIHENLEMING